MNSLENFQNNELPENFQEKYETKEEIGTGVSSIVKRCIHRKTFEEFAVKIIDVSYVDENDDLVDSVMREIEILKKISNHSNIITLVEVFKIPSSIFLVFQLLKRGELFDYLTEVVKCGEKRTRKIMSTLFQALSFLHSKNIVHRDLKPENLLLDEHLNIYLSDFGFSVQIKNEEPLYELLGTPAYMAPEMLKATVESNHPGYGKPIDLWACGVIMYSLLAGAPPFWHRKQMIMLRRIMEGKISFLKPEWSDITDAAKDLISKLLVVDPQQRLTADEALLHPFFHQHNQQLKDRRQISRRKFRIVSLVVLASCCIVTRWRSMLCMPVSLAGRDPYAIRRIRRHIDASAFRVYGHWVKKAGDQNRAALFENGTKTNQYRVALLEASENVNN